MNRIQLFAPLIAAAAAISACAHTSPTAPIARSASTDCSRLHSEIADTEHARRVAYEQQQDAWKTIVPFLIAGRYLDGKTAYGEADTRLGELNAEFSRQGCVRHVG